MVIVQTQGSCNRLFCLTNSVQVQCLPCYQICAADDIFGCRFLGVIRVFFQQHTCNLNVAFREMSALSLEILLGCFTK